MGRTKVKSKKITGSSSAEKEPPSIEALFAKAQSLLTQCDYDLAQKFALRILQREPANADARELLGVTQLEKGQLEDARQVLFFLIHLCLLLHVSVFKPVFFLPVSSALQTFRI